MKKLIKKILREHEGGIPRPPKGNLRDVGNTAKKYFIAANLIANTWDDAEFDKWKDLEGTEQWYRREALDPMLKLLNLDLGTTETSEIFWLAYDNKEGLRDGTFTSYKDLNERPLKTYKVSCVENESESVEYEYSVLVDAYEEGDAWSDVWNNEDGEYHWYEWEHLKDDFSKEIYDSEMGERDVVGIEEVGIVDDTSRKGAVSEINEHIGASPVENDIISELEGLIENWDGCEEGQPVPCRYKNDVQSLIEKYKSKSLYEHTDNFTSHSDEPYIGELIVNTNPGCTHYKSEGFIEDINDLPDNEGTTITYRVTNNGDTYEEGDTLTKTMDQLSPLVNEQYTGKGSSSYPIVVTDTYAHLMELFKNRLGDEKIKELLHTDIWNLRATEPYTKIFNVEGDMQIKQLIQFMVDKGLPERYQEFVGENLPPIHQYGFTRTHEQRNLTLYESWVTINDTNYESALCSAEQNWWEHDPEEELVETMDSDYIGNEEWSQVHINGKEVWHARGVHRDNEKPDDKYDPNKWGC